jgi:hypothetical protein
MLMIVLPLLAGMSLRGRLSSGEMQRRSVTGIAFLPAYVTLSRREHWRLPIVQYSPTQPFDVFVVD